MEDPIALIKKAAATVNAQYERRKLESVKFDYDPFVKNGILFDTLFDTFQDLSLISYFR